MRNYVFGDTGGHASQLFVALKSIGVDIDSGSIPEDVRIIHLGDLIHKGPHSQLILEVVNKLVRRNPTRWVQVLGNHEFQHIEGAPVFWRCDCDIHDVDIICTWYEMGLAVPSFAVPAFTSMELEVSAKPKITIPESGILFTHAGLSWDWWNSLGQPDNPVEVSMHLNSFPVDLITVPGEMLGYQGGKPGPVWAVGNTEVFNSWQAKPEAMPFIQMHGHTSSYKWGKSEWWRKDKGFKTFREATKLNPETRAVITRMSDSLLIGVDPGYSKLADTASQPYLFFET